MAAHRSGGGKTSRLLLLWLDVSVSWFGCSTLVLSGWSLLLLLLLMWRPCRAVGGDAGHHREDECGTKCALSTPMVLKHQEAAAGWGGKSTVYTPHLFGPFTGEFSATSRCIWHAARCFCWFPPDARQRIRPADVITATQSFWHFANIIRRKSLTPTHAAIRHASTGRGCGYVGFFRQRSNRRWKEMLMWGEPPPSCCNYSMEQFGI